MIMQLSFILLINWENQAYEGTSLKKKSKRPKFIGIKECCNELLIEANLFFTEFKGRCLNLYQKREHLYIFQLPTEW